MRKLAPPTQAQSSESALSIPVGGLDSGVAGSGIATAASGAALKGHSAGPGSAPVVAEAESAAEVSEPSLDMRAG